MACPLSSCVLVSNQTLLPILAHLFQTCACREGLLATHKSATEIHHLQQQQNMGCAAQDFLGTDTLTFKGIYSTNSLQSSKISLLLENQDSSFDWFSKRLSVWESQRHQDYDFATHHITTSQGQSRLAPMAGRLRTSGTNATQRHTFRIQ